MVADNSESFSIQQSSVINFTANDDSNETILLQHTDSLGSFQKNLGQG